MNPVTANPHWPISSPENSGSQWLPTQSTSYHLWSPVTMGVIRGLSECASLSPCICLLLFASFLFVSLSLSVHVCPPSLLLCLSFFLSIPVSLGWKEPERERWRMNKRGFGKSNNYSGGIKYWGRPNYVNILWFLV